jgi:SAM-dependent methyltransferase
MKPVADDQPVTDRSSESVKSADQKRSESMLAYYRSTLLNAGEIPLVDAAAWQSHLRKRVNLYENHLGIPLGLLRGRSVLEFGCSSGENALVLAACGAKLTLIEPNTIVIPRMKQLFRQFGLESQIVRLCHDQIQECAIDELFDLVLAEGFLFTLANRDEMLGKLCGWVRPGGIGVVSFNDRIGMFLECTKRLALRRACQLAGIDDVGGEASLGLAQDLFGNAFGKLNASRSLRTWWKDNLVSPFITMPYLWSFPELLPLIEQAGCEFYASSPGFSSVDDFSWYKNVPTVVNRHLRLLEHVRNSFVYFLMGAPQRYAVPAAQEVMDSVLSLQQAITVLTTCPTPRIDTIHFPAPLREYLAAHPDPEVKAFGTDLGRFFESMRLDSLPALLRACAEIPSMQTLWGASYFYVAFKKPLRL